MKITRLNQISDQTIKNVAAYARVSTLSEEQEESFETQVSYYTTLISNTPGWKYIGVYADRGKSGLSADKRPEFQKMIQDAMNNKIDIILTKSISRFCRNSLEAQTYIHKLKEKGVEVRFEREGISSLDAQADMIFSFLAAVAEEESKSISQNTRWTYEKLAQEGIRHLGNNRVLGYDEINGVLTPNKDSWVIEYIYEEYTNGTSPRKIATNLEKLGFITMRGKPKLNDTTIANILRNELYKGDQRIQKKPPRSLLSKKPDYSKEYTSYYVLDNHEPIIPKDLWNKAQDTLRNRKHKA